MKSAVADSYILTQAVPNSIEAVVGDSFETIFVGTCGSEIVGKDSRQKLLELIQGKDSYNVYGK